MFRLNRYSDANPNYYINMMFPNHLFIRLREVRILALFVCCILISSCSKEASISIPDHLTGSEWAMYTEETDYTLRFTSDSECTFTEQTADAEPTEYHYNYIYRNPDLTLIPRDQDREILSGSLYRWDKKSIGMTLYAPDGTVVFHASKNVEYIWQCRFSATCSVHCRPAVRRYRAPCFLRPASKWTTISGAMLPSLRLRSTPC